MWRLCPFQVQGKSTRSDFGPFSAGLRAVSDDRLPVASFDTLVDARARLDMVIKARAVIGAHRLSEVTYAPIAIGGPALLRAPVCP